MFNHDIFVQGFPGKSSTHGGLGWSTIALLSRGDENIIVDVGSFGVRKQLFKKLEEKELTPEDITMVLLTHTHWDHCVNWTLFPNATIVVGRIDMEWALGEPVGSSDIPELYIEELERSSRVRYVDHLEEVVPGIVAHQTKGHTPGHIAYSVDNGEYDLVFSGDAAKNRAELLSRNVDMTLNLADSQSSIKYLWELWKKKQNSLMIPGHDIPMKLNDGEAVYIQKREANLECWFSDSLTELTKVPLSKE